MTLVTARAAQRARNESRDGMRRIVAVRTESLRSLAPVAGPAVTAAKRFTVRLQYHFLDDIAQQASAALHRVRRERRLLTRDVEALRARIARLEHTLPPR